MTWEGLNPPYATIVADPPWHFGEPFAAPSPTKYPYRHGIGRMAPYSAMAIGDVAALPVSDIAAMDCRLFLWTTNRHLRHAWSVIEAWGFKPADRVFVWCKEPMGTANVTTEFLLMGKRGRPPKLPWCNTTWFAWPRSMTHSRKPPASLDMIESWSPGPYVELFARAPRLGWDSWGYGYETPVFRKVSNTGEQG